jgi:hypothetical protein
VCTILYFANHLIIVGVGISLHGNQQNFASMHVTMTTSYM